MFSYLLSVAIAFIVFGTVNNFLSRLQPDWYYDRDLEEIGGWVIAVVMSVFWFIAVPLLFIGFIMYLLKLLTDKIAEFILNKIEKRKSSKLDKENV